MELGKLVIHKSTFGDIVPHRILEVNRIDDSVFDDLGTVMIGDDLGRCKYQIHEFETIFHIPTRIYELLYD